MRKRADERHDDLGDDQAVTCINVYVTTHSKQKLRVRAAEAGLSMSAYVYQLIDHDLAGAAKP